MTDQVPAKSLPRKIVSYIVGFAISLLIGAAIERVTDHEFLQRAEAAQQRWIDTLSKTSPIEVGRTYWYEVRGAFSGDASEGSYSAQTKANYLTAPLIALLMTGMRLFESSGVVVIIQIALGALAVAVINYRRTGDILFDNGALNLFLGPIAVVLAASMLSLALWGVMIGALKLLSWVTGFAAAAAGATGVVGFCWYCIARLGERGAEHVVSPHV